jgi:hypothetical protein
MGKKKELSFLTHHTVPIFTMYSMELVSSANVFIYCKCSVLKSGRVDWEDRVSTIWRV